MPIPGSHSQESWFSLECSLVSRFFKWVYWAMKSEKPCILWEREDEGNFTWLLFLTVLKNYTISHHHNPRSLSLTFLLQTSFVPTSQNSLSVIWYWRDFFPLSGPTSIWVKEQGELDRELDLWTEQYTHQIWKLHCFFQLRKTKSWKWFQDL